MSILMSILGVSHDSDIFFTFLVFRTPASVSSAKTMTSSRRSPAAADVVLFSRRRTPSVANRPQICLNLTETKSTTEETNRSRDL